MTVQINSITLRYNHCSFIQLPHREQFMKQLQKWFDILAGISEAERHRQALAQAIFNHDGPDLSALATPACWRRASHVRSGQR
jgi:hypothetical protein